jgi:hypothetical protein
VCFTEGQSFSFVQQIQVFSKDIASHWPSRAMANEKQWGWIATRLALSVGTARGMTSSEATGRILARPEPGRWILEQPKRRPRAVLAKKGSENENLMVDRMGTI